MFKGMLLNLLKVLGRYVIRQFDDGMTERMNETNELLRTLVQARAEDHQLLQTDHQLLQTAIAELAESSQMLQSISMIALSLLDSEMNFNSVLVKSQSDDDLTQLKFKNNLHNAHGLPPNSRCAEFIAANVISEAPEHIPPTEFLSFDMATGRALQSKAVIAAHILPHRWKINLLTTFSLSVTNDPRNGLMLYKPVECAFDRAQLCIDVESTEGQDLFKFRLLDESLRNKKLIDYVC